MEIVKRNIILTFDELRILLYSQGYRRCEGVYMPRKEFSQEDIIRALAKLEKSGLLTVDSAEPQSEALPLVFTEDTSDGEDKLDLYPEEEFYIRSDLLKMIGIIGSPDASEIMQLSPERNLYCYYSERGIVTSERYPCRIECVRLTLYSADEFEQWRRDLEEDVQ